MRFHPTRLLSMLAFLAGLWIGIFFATSTNAWEGETFLPRDFAVGDVLDGSAVEMWADNIQTAPASASRWNIGLCPERSNLILFIAGLLPLLISAVRQKTHYR